MDRNGRIQDEATGERIEINPTSGVLKEGTVNDIGNFIKASIV